MEKWAKRGEAERYPGLLSQLPSLLSLTLARPGLTPLRFLSHEKKKLPDCKWAMSHMYKLLRH